MAKVEELVEQIEQLTVLEVADLVEALEDKFGVSAAAPVAAVAAAPGAEAGAAEEEKDAYNVVITAVGDGKINVIKAIRGINSELGLKEAKDLVENLPATVKENAKTDDAKDMQSQLEEAGATVELQ